MQNCPKRNPRKLNETDQLQFVETEKLEFAEINPIIFVQEL